MIQLPENTSIEELRSVLQEIFDEYAESAFPLEELDDEWILMLYDLVITPTEAERNKKFEEMEKEIQKQSLKIRTLQKKLKEMVENYDHFQAEIKQKFASSALNDLASDIFLEQNLE